MKEPVYLTPGLNRRVLKAIHGVLEQEGACLPQLTNMELVAYAAEGRGWDRKHAWSIYISHDPCHDGVRGRKEDRNTVVAFSRPGMRYAVIGRELPYKLARCIALGIPRCDWT